MLCNQFLLRALRLDHPSNAVASADPEPRRIRSTLQSKFLPAVQPYLQDGVIPGGSRWQKTIGGPSPTPLRQLHQTASSGSLPRQSAPRREASPATSGPPSHC